MADTHVRIVEMGPRDGLQNEASLVSTANKIALVNKLSRCGFERIEATSFVSPKWVPQMADAKEVMQGITRAPGLTYCALTPNLRGFEAALAAGADEVAVFGSASDGFSRANINASVDEALERFVPILAAAKHSKIPVRGYVSCVTDCPYDGPTPPGSVARVVARLLDMGCFEISLGDTIGKGTPQTVEAMLKAALDQAAPDHLAGHFHDTNGHALDNIAVCLNEGLRVFDASIAGLGGCPYAPGAKGNVATEDLVAMLHARGYKTGIDTAALSDTIPFAKGLRSQ